MYSFYDIIDILREIEILEKLAAARTSMIELIEKFSRKKSDALVALKIKQIFIRPIRRLNRLLPKGHRWRGDVV